MPAATSELKRHEGFHSTWLEADRTLSVYLPPGYPDAGPYPLLLLHDGQNLFEAERAFHGQSWRVGETADRLIAEGAIRPLVIVGIDHGEEARVREYTPTADGQPGAGRVTDHAHFLLEEVLPFLAKTYAVATTFDALGLGGSSLGGLATIGVALAAPGRFGRLIAMSPSVWWDRRAILRGLRRRPLAPAPKVWVDAGLKEGAKTVRDARDLADLLRGEPGPTPAPDLEADAASRIHFVIDLDGDHSESSWARRLGPALKFCFGSVSIRTGTRI